MNLVARILNVTEEKIGLVIHEGRFLYDRDKLCNQVGIENDAKLFSVLKENEFVTLRTPEGYTECVTESGAYKMILVGGAIKAEEARAYICEEILPNHKG